LLAAGTSESEVKLWYVPAILELPKFRPGEPARLPPLATLKLADRVLSLAFSPDGSLMAAASALPDGETLKPVVQLWDLSKLYTEGEAGLNPVQTIQAQSGPLWEVAFSAQGDWVAAAGSGLAIWDTSTGAPADQVEGPFGSLAVSSAGDTLAAAGEEQASLWRMLSQPVHASGAPHWLQGQFAITPLEGRVTSLAFSPNGRFLIILYEQGILDLWGVSP
jgi:WD40 repeat protein